MISCYRTTKATLGKNNKTMFTGVRNGKEGGCIAGSIFSLQKIEGSTNVGWNK